MMERGCFIHHPLSLQIEDLYGPAAGVSFLISMISALSFVFAWLSSHILLSALREIRTARRQADVAKQRFLHRSLSKTSVLWHGRWQEGCQLRRRVLEHVCCG